VLWLALGVLIVWGVGWQLRRVRRDRAADRVTSKWLDDRVRERR
jgi:hypothetical protein